MATATFPTATSIKQKVCDYQFDKHILLTTTISHRLTSFALRSPPIPFFLPYPSIKEFERSLHQRAWTGQEQCSRHRCEGLSVMDVRRSMTGPSPLGAKDTDSSPWG